MQGSHQDATNFEYQASSVVVERGRGAMIGGWRASATDAARAPTRASCFLGNVDLDERVDSLSFVLALRMSHSAKRSASPLPRDLDNIRRFRLSVSKKDTDKNQGHATASSSHPQLGQEVISLSPFLPQATTHQNVNDLILQTAARLAREGKRLTRAPQLL